PPSPPPPTISLSGEEGGSLEIHEGTCIRALEGQDVNEVYLWTVTGPSALTWHYAFPPGSADNFADFCGWIPGDYRSVVTFSDLDLSSFNDANFSATFQATFIASMAATASIESDAVAITSIVSGSCAVHSTAIFSSSGARAAFSLALTSNPGDIFASSTFFDDFGPVTATADTPPPPTTVKCRFLLPFYHRHHHRRLVPWGHRQHHLRPRPSTAITTPCRLHHFPQATEAMESAVFFLPRWDLRPLVPHAQISVSICWNWDPLPVGIIGQEGDAVLLEVDVGEAASVELVELDYEEETSSVTYTGKPDVEPPVITLVGDAVVEVRLMAEYRDAGASAVDLVDGSVRVDVVGLEAVNTELATPADVPFVLTYSAQDAAGNAAVPMTRSVAVVDPCSPPTFYCRDLDLCSVCPAGSSDPAECICMSSWVALEAEVEVVEEFVPVDDVTAPVIILLGDGQLAVNNQGEVFMAHVVKQFTDFVAPLTHAEDNIDGNLTDVITKFGQVDTAILTTNDSPHIITYNVRDAAGNEARIARRRVYVVSSCPEGWMMCSGADQCVERILDCSLGRTEESEFSAQANTPPEVALVGVEVVSVLQHRAYARCGKGALLTEVCDRGASAVDAEEGVLDARVLACSPDNVSFPFVEVGIQPCEVDTTVPGRYQIVFSVTDSSGAFASTVRTVVVEPSCPIGEALCAGRTDCSRGGLCLEDLGGLPEEEETEPSPPAMALVLSDTAPTSVRVKKNARYELCAMGQTPAAEGDCEPGVTAVSSATGVDLSMQVLSCPPEDCLPFGCPGHEMWLQKGLRSCLDTAADVGTVFELRFTVFDDNMPPRNATVARLITIVSPCAEDEELCEGDVCSSSPCAVHMTLTTEEDVLPPEVGLLSVSSPSAARNESGDSDAAPVLTSSSGTVRTSQTSYGQLAPGGLLVRCSSWGELEAAATALSGDEGDSGGPNCSAAAWDAEDGDLTSSLEVEQVYDSPVCSGGEEGGDDAPRCISSGSCPPEALRAGECAPGVYEYAWSVVDLGGSEARVVEVVEVVERATVEIQVRLNSGAEDLAAAEAEAAAIEAGGDEAQAVRSALAQLAGVSADEIELDAVSAEEEEEGASPKGYVLVVDAIVHVATSSIPSASAATGDRRRLTSMPPLVSMSPDSTPSSPPASTEGDEGEVTPSAAMVQSAAIAAAVQAGAAGSGEGTLSSYLEAAADDLGVSGLPTESLGLNQEPQLQQRTSTVDEEAAAWANLRGEVTQMHQAQATASAQLASVEEEMASLRGTAHVQGLASEAAEGWLRGREEVQSRFDELSQGLTTAVENAELLAQNQATISSLTMNATEAAKALFLSTLNAADASGYEDPDRELCTTGRNTSGSAEFVISLLPEAVSPPPVSRLHQRHQRRLQGRGGAGGATSKTAGQQSEA
ncbi:hypothetical protein CYMTET_5378, partial [Cymbomonas tetramitiformis]